VLADDDGDRGLEAEAGGRGIEKRASGDEGHTRGFQALQLGAELGDRSGAPVDHSRVGVGEDGGRHTRKALSITHGQRIVEAGAPLEGAHAAMILVHGRGATAEDIMTIAAEVQQPRWAYIAPQATGSAWYPNPFTAPLESNEPHLSAALEMLGRIVERVEASVPAHRIVLLGFSQGACLTLEFAARNARRLGGVVGFSGGLIGPEGTPRDYPGSFEGAPVFLGCSDVDPYIGKDRVEEAAAVLAGMGAEVEMRLYPGMGHLVSEDEIQKVRELVALAGQ